jgi:hypothetical protein
MRTTSSYVRRSGIVFLRHVERQGPDVHIVGARALR